MSLQDRKVDKDREWITIHGRKILWYVFISAFDGMYFRDKFDHIRGTEKNQIYSEAALLQMATDDYTMGNDNIEVFRSELDRIDLAMPEDPRYPQVLVELFDQMEQRHNLNLSDILDDAVKQSERNYNRILQERNAEEQRQKVASEILDGCTDSTDTPSGKIKMLLYLQEHRPKTNDSDSTQQIDKEHKAMSLWISILVQSFNSNFITHGQMLSLVQDDILEEFDISDLLQGKYDDERDYEWYSEDFLGSDLSDETILQVKDILALAEPKFKEILGISDH